MARSRSPERQPIRRRGRWLGIGTLIAVAVAIVGIVMFTRTDRGREEILTYTLNTVGGQLNGTLTVDRLEGNLLSGARLYDVEIRGLDDEVLIESDSAFIDYRLPTLLGGDIVIKDLVLYHPDIYLRRLPGDSLWNYQQILSDTVETPEDGEDRATLVERLQLINARIRVRTPWEPDDDLSGPARERESRVALADTSRIVVDSVEGGMLRTMYFAVEEAVLSDLLISSDEREGTRLMVESGRALAYIWADPPLRITEVNGQIGIRSGVVRFDAPRVVSGGSAVSTSGIVDLTGDEPRFDLVVEGNRIALRDLQWLYPPLPDRGDLGGRLTLETRPGGLFFMVRDGRLQTPDTRIVGDVGMLMGDTLRFTSVDLHADPLNVGTVQRMLPGSTPIDGLTIGSAVISRPES
jgi:hypothetical protein